MWTPYLKGSLASRALTYAVALLAMLIGIERNSLSPLRVIVLVVGLVTALHLTNVFAESLARSIDLHQRISPREQLRLAAAHLKATIVVIAPVVIFGLSWAGVFSLENAFHFSIAWLLLVMFWWGFAAVRSGGGSLARAAFAGLEASLVGWAMILLRILLT